MALEKGIIYFYCIFLKAKLSLYVYCICKNILIVETGSNRGPLESLKPGRHPASCFSIMDDLLAIGKWGDKKAKGWGEDIFKQEYKDKKAGGGVKKGNKFKEGWGTNREKVGEGKQPSCILFFIVDDLRAIGNWGTNKAHSGGTEKRGTTGRRSKVGKMA